MNLFFAWLIFTGGVCVGWGLARGIVKHNPEPPDNEDLRAFRSRVKARGEGNGA